MKTREKNGEEWIDQNSEDYSEILTKLIVVAESFKLIKIDKKDVEAREEEDNMDLDLENMEVIRVKEESDENIEFDGVKEVKEAEV